MPESRPEFDIAVQLQASLKGVDCFGEFPLLFVGAAEHLNLEEAPELASPSKDRGLVAVDDALQVLERVDPRKAKVVELKFFGGLSVEETADVLRISPQTVMRDWKMARAWLMGELAQ